MLTEAHYAAVLNYFFFLLGDEALALNAAFKTTQRVQRKIRKTPKDPVDVILIREASFVLKKWRKKRNHGAGAPPKSDWKISNPDSHAAWKEFLKLQEIDTAEILV